MDLVGKRARLVGEVENYPVIIVEAGEVGTITSADDERIWIKLDKYHPELDEWNNELEVWNWDDRPVADLVEIITVEE